MHACSQMAGGRSRPGNLVTASKIRGSLDEVDDRWVPMHPDEPFPSHRGNIPFLHFPARGGWPGSPRGPADLPSWPCLALPILFGPFHFSFSKHITPPWDASAGRRCEPSHHARPPDRPKQTTFEPRCEEIPGREPHSMDLVGRNRKFVS